MSDTSSTVDFRDLLRKPIGDWESRGPLPVGHYFGKVVDVEEGNSSKKGTKYFAFFVQIATAGPDVDQAQLGSVDLTAYEFPNRRYPNGPSVVWITPGAMPMNRVFFENMGFPPTKPMDECINEMRGKNVMIGIGVEESESNTNADGSKRKYNQLVSITGDPREK
jgi:hypothetical protein